MASVVIDRDFYMNDLLKSINLSEETIKIQKQITAILSIGDFNICKCAVNALQIFKDKVGLYQPSNFTLYSSIIPYFGSLWEKSEEEKEFYTLLLQMEACLNSRPLTPLLSKSNKFKWLTMSHFMVAASIEGDLKF